MCLFSCIASQKLPPNDSEMDWDLSTEHLQVLGWPVQRLAPDQSDQLLRVGFAFGKLGRVGEFMEGWIGEHVFQIFGEA